MATDLLNQRVHLQGESCLERTDSEAKILDFSHMAGSPPHRPPSLPPSLHQSALQGLASLDFPVNRRLPPPLWLDGGGCESPYCNLVSCYWQMSSDDVCILLLPVSAGDESPGWTGRVVLLHGDLPALQQTAWRRQKKMNKGTLKILNLQKKQSCSIQVNC